MCVVSVVCQCADLHSAHMHTQTDAAGGKKKKDVDGDEGRLFVRRFIEGVARVIK